MTSNKQRKVQKIQQLKADLAEYREARLAILSGQSYTVKNGDDTRTLTLVDFGKLNALISETESQIEALEDSLSGGSSRVLTIGGTWR